MPGGASSIARSPTTRADAAIFSLVYGDEICQSARRNAWRPVMQRSRSILVPFALGTLFASAPIALAGPLTLVTPDGGTVQIGAAYRDGSTAVAAIVDNGAGDENPALGKVTFTIPDEPNAVTSTIANIGVGGHLAGLESIDWGTAGLFSFEPVTVP